MVNEALKEFAKIETRRLNIGAGADDPGPGWIALDIVPTFRPQVLGDAHRLPFADGAFRAVKAHHVLEHIPRDYFVFHWEPKQDLTEDKSYFKDERNFAIVPAAIVKAGSRSFIEARHGLVDVMNEIWRVVAPGGQVWIEVPVFPTEEAIADPTHGSFLVSGTFDYFTRCERHTDDPGHEFTCRESHRQMYGIKPWRIRKREKVNHQRILVVFMEKLDE